MLGHHKINLLKCSTIGLDTISWTSLLSHLSFLVFLNGLNSRVALLLQRLWLHKPVNSVKCSNLSSDTVFYQGCLLNACVLKHKLSFFLFWRLVLWNRNLGKHWFDWRWFLVNLAARNWLRTKFETNHTKAKKKVLLRKSISSLPKSCSKLRMTKMKRTSGQPSEALPLGMSLCFILYEKDFSKLSLRLNLFVFLNGMQSLSKKVAVKQERA